MKFSFRKSDRNSILLLLLIVVVVTVTFPLLSERENTSHQPFPKGKGAQFTSKKYTSAKFVSPSLQEGDRGRLFPFDPNTADSTQLLRLGLRPWQVRNIYKYRAKGGRYRQKEDFAMLYGLTLEQYRRLEPYIRIKPEVMARDVINGNGNDNGNRLAHNKGVTKQVQQEKVPVPVPVNKLTQGEFVDINPADTAELKRIPGIGSYFARRIVELRQRRQAFVSPDELLSIRNFPETALTYMTASQNFAKIHINQSSLQQLKAHPLINYTQATDILRYRRLNGNIRSVNDISNLPSFSQEQLSRLAPFLLFD
ncbi:MAG: helix-hairpin-helix domain-containing protein [Prevotella sp.]|nr:helix-hairpin-helix domain-containing protein [Prevotella sp.]